MLNILYNILRWADGGHSMRSLELVYKLNVYFIKTTILMVPSILKKFFDLEFRNLRYDDKFY